MVAAVESDAKNRLDGIGLLASLTPDERTSLGKRCRWRRYSANEQIVDKDSSDRDVYFIVEGAVQIVNFSLTGREIAFARINAGGYFGELAAIDGEPRSASVVAIENCLVATAAPQLFNDLITGHAAIATHVLNQLAGIVRASNERIMDLSTLGAVQRVHMELLRLAEEEPEASDDWVIKAVPTHKVIASRASTTRETVARSMSQLAAGGIIERKGNTIFLLEREKLEKLAGALGEEWTTAL